MLNNIGEIGGKSWKVVAPPCGEFVVDTRGGCEVAAAGGKSACHGSWVAGARRQARLPIVGKVTKLSLKSSM